MIWICYDSERENQRLQSLDESEHNINNYISITQIACTKPTDSCGIIFLKCEIVDIRKLKGHDIQGNGIAFTIIEEEIPMAE